MPTLKNIVKIIKLKPFYHITHIDNLKSILEKGIFSRSKCTGNNIQIKDIADREVLAKRIIQNHDIVRYVPLYFASNTPMLYNVMNKYKENVVMLEISKEIIALENTYFTNGNYASDETDGVYDNIRNLEKLEWDIIYSTRPAYNNVADHSYKSARMSEILVMDYLPVKYIKGFYLPPKLKYGFEDLDIKLNKTGLERDKFPYKHYKLTHGGISPARAKSFKTFGIFQQKSGDIFESQLQAIVNPVNCVGVMGAGLAKEFKSKYPDMFADYAVKCKNNEVKIGEPYPYFIPNQRKIIINFPTKNHFSENSRIEDIESGLKYFVQNYRKWGIKTVAFPALGAGKGKLKWEDVMPVMINYLSFLDIDSELYTPGL